VAEHFGTVSMFGTDFGTGAGMGMPGMGMGMGYQPLDPQSTPRDPATMMQSAYPAGGAMNTFSGGAAQPPMQTTNQMPAGNTLAGGGTEMHTGGGSEGGGHAGHATIDKSTGQAPRRCTDVQCCFQFLVVAIGALTLVAVCKQHGNMGRLTHGVDYYGRVCGVDAGVENMPFLFWCRGDAPAAGVPALLDLDRPSCVPYCPTSSNVTVRIPCLQHAEKTTSSIPGGQFGNVETLMVQMQESLVMTTPYATRPRGGRYCIPLDKTLEDLVLTSPKALGPFSANRILTTLGTLGHLYWLLLIATILSIAGGFGFLFAMKHCPRSLAYCFLLPLALLFFLYALGFTFSVFPLISETSGISEWYMPRQPFYQRWDTVHASLLGLLTAVILWVITACLLGMAWNYDVVGLTDLLTVSFECLRVVPGMTYIPVVEGLVKFLVFWLGLQGFRVIASVGFIEKNRIHVNGAKFAGLSRDFIPATGDVRFYLMAVVWIIFFKWMMETVQAFSQFVVSWCVFKWWQVKKDKGKKPGPATGVCEGVKSGFIYHFGSILKAATQIPQTRPWRIIYWLTANVSDTSSPTALGKAVDCIAGLTCGCFGLKGCCGLNGVALKVIRDNDCVVKDCFNDIVIRSNDFEAANTKAHMLLEHSHKIVQFLYRDLAEQTMSVIGVMVISCFTTAGVYITVTNLEIYCDPISALYIADPYLVTCLCWVLSAYIAFGFMTVWQHSADSLLYCYCWHRQFARKTVKDYIPDNLRFIVGMDDTVDDRYPYYGKARNNMYLRFWMPMIGMEAPKPGAGPAASPKKAPAPSVMQTQGP